MSWVLQLPPTEAGGADQEPPVGSMVRTADRERLEAALRAPDSGLRPIPAQLLHAGRLARVVSVRFDATRRGFYRLAGIPGEWQPEWLRPAHPRFAAAPDGGGPTT